jgi:hypothetical protein
MSYGRAWSLVVSLDETFAEPVLIARTYGRWQRGVDGEGPPPLGTTLGGANGLGWRCTFSDFYQSSRCFLSCL